MPPPPALSPDMALVPAGKFIMGSDEGSRGERPAHSVYLDAFYIDKIEVTNAQFAQFLNEQGNQEEGGATWLDFKDKDCWITKSLGRYQPKGGYENHPVIEVTWYGAKAYCEWRGRSVSKHVRLPTEAEWEKAASWDPVAGAKRLYPWGNEWDAGRVNADWPITNPTEYRPIITAQGKPNTAPVGSHPEGASPYGVLDMAGNAWEWVADWYAEDYYGRSPAQNPLGARVGECTVMGPNGREMNECKVLRGGSWRSTPAFVRTIVREYIYPAFTYDVGFRCVQE